MSRFFIEYNGSGHDTLTIFSALPNTGTTEVSPPGFIQPPAAGYVNATILFDVDTGQPTGLICRQFLHHDGKRTVDTLINLLQALLGLNDPNVETYVRRVVAEAKLEDYNVEQMLGSTTSLNVFNRPNVDDTGYKVG